MSHIHRIETNNFMKHKQVSLRFPEHGIVVIRGENACLRGDTEIVDPVAETAISVEDRWRLGQPFHIWALGPKGILVAEALPPQRFKETPMLRVTLESGEYIVVTPNHLFLSGMFWESAFSCYSRRHDSDPVLLTTSEFTDLHNQEFSEAGIATSKVADIQAVVAEPYFDFHVPVFNNYWAAGFWNHNSGKSTIVEAVAVALWGKTVRGTGWGKPQQHSTTKVWTDTVTVERERSENGTVRLRWAPSGRELREFESASKGQPELESIVGDMNSWQRASVFSSQDLFTFSRATDGERKRFLEGMLGLDVFDAGLVRCRQELSALREAHVKAEHRATTLALQVQAEATRMTDAGEVLGAAPPEISSALIMQMSRDFKAAQTDLMKATSVRTSAGNAKISLEGAIQRTASELQKYKSMVSCPTCQQVLTDAAREAMSGSAARTAMESKRTLALALERMANADLDIADLKSEYSALEKKLNALREADVRFRDWSVRSKNQQVKLDEIARRMVSFREVLGRLTIEVNAAKVSIAELEVVEKVLGLRGVRLHVMARAISGLESMANVWINRLLPGASLRLTTEGETKKGAPSDKLALEVLGLDHEGAFNACSGGERRRVDVALILALAEVRSAAVGRTPGTIMCDEVLDTLDSEGIAAVSEALVTMSRDRCILVVTHSSVLADELRADMVVIVDNGRVTVR